MSPVIHYHVLLVQTLVSVPGSKVTITGDDRLILDESGLTISCRISSAGARDVNRITSIQLYRSMYDSIYLEHIVSVRNNGSLTWIDVTLHSRPGVSATGQLNSVLDSLLTFSITPNGTRCEDAVDYRCAMTMVTSAGNLMDVSNSKNVALYPPGRYA